MTSEDRARLDEALLEVDRELEASARAKAQRRHIPGMAPPHIPAPSWWMGDRAAFNSGLAAGQQLGEPAARRERPRAPVIGRAALTGAGV